MKTALQTLAGILAGVVLAFLLVVAVEMFSAVVHPFPDDFDGSTEEVCLHVENYPQWVLGVVVPLWAATAFAGVWIAGRVGTRLASAIVALFILAAVVFNLSMLPYPLWFKLTTLLAVGAAVTIGIRWSRHKKVVVVDQTTTIEIGSGNDR